MHLSLGVSEEEKRRQKEHARLQKQQEKFYRAEQLRLEKEYRAQQLIEVGTWLVLG